ncbi:ATP-binding protein [Nocardioides donggukensis]|uniref:ATP-binding protein n=1 Tax=Nocardioides donggukensis TaxID=2774019 RepID=A0A927K1D2_9ACTN|nr:ATP-binding protein [Nocardioides donggukensis]MBD8868194.1 ATP-binding protein [Nocardioides donggukensis]
MESDVVAASVHVATLSKIFKPSAPTDDRQLFRGRAQQLSSLVSAMQEEGQHAIVFGERGVGKTSLAYMGMAIFGIQAPDGIRLRLTCGAEDDFSTVWQKLVPRLQQFLDTTDDEVRASLAGTIDRIEDMFMDAPTPESVGRALHLLASRAPLLVVVDEFDRINGYAHGDAFADLVKQISDDLVECTVCLVGVADDVSGLIAGHASVDRSLRQIAMPRMTQDELSEIVTRGFQAFGERSGYTLDIDASAVSAIANLSQGFPYYTHLLASSVGKRSIYANEHVITFEQVFDALMQAKDDAEPSIKENYYKATIAARSDATFDKTILACAMAVPDHLGHFTASDVRPPLEELLGVPRRNSDFNAHLKRFSSEPPYILESTSVTRTPRYRFRNPLMKPFVLMQGFASGLLSQDRLSLRDSNEPTNQG